MTRTSWADARRVRRYLPLVIIFYLCPAPAFAQVPDATIQHIVELNVKAAEIRYLHDSGQIDDPTLRERRDATQSELNALWQSIGRFSAAEQNDARRQTDGLTKLRLEALQPGWDAKIAVAQKQREQHNRAVNDAIPIDARAALELQRRRLSLQQRRDHGEITPEEFAVEDKKAFDGIIAFRNKYVPEGQEYVARFDEQLEKLTQAIANNPATPLPVSRVLPGQEGGTSPADYQRDVRLGADLLARQDENGTRYWVKKEINADTFRETDKILSTDLARLSQKWLAAGNGGKFDRDCRQRPNAGTAAVQRPTTAAPASAPASVLDSFGLFGILGIFGLIGILFLAGFVYLVYRLSRRTPVEDGVSDVYGTAHYAPRQVDIADETCLANGVFFGKSSAPGLAGWPLDAPGAPVCSTPEHHTLIVARTRTGKGTRVIVPTLLRYAGSAFVIDPPARRNPQGRSGSASPDTRPRHPRETRPA